MLIQNIKAMDIQADIKWIQKELNKVEDATLLQAIKNILKYNAKKVPQERISIEQYNEEIEESILQVKNGDFYTQEEVEKMAEEW